MTVSPETASFVAQLQQFSHHKLQHSEDLAALIELARQRKQEHILNDLSFFAKFVSNTLSVMKRVGPDAEGYDKLSAEFRENLEKASSFVRLLVNEAPDETKQHFTQTYFTMNADALNSFLQLLNDISWLKNWNIDHGVKTS